jgi:hypothetical protein
MSSRYQTSDKSLETPYVLGDLTSGQAATIVVYKLSDSSTPALTSNTCSEIGSTGVFKWAVANITTQPTVFTEYLFIMTDALGIKSKGKFSLGGYPNIVTDTKTDTGNIRSTDIPAVKTDTGNIRSVDIPLVSKAAGTKGTDAIYDKAVLLPADPASESLVEDYIDGNSTTIISTNTSQNNTILANQGISQKDLKNILALVTKKANKSDVNSLLDELKKLSK